MSSAGPQLPDLYRALLDPEKLRDLFFDIEQSAVLLGVSVKWAALAHAESSSMTLQQILKKFSDGSLLGAQLRYLHAGREWWDTLLVTPGGVQLTRIEPPASV